MKYLNNETKAREQWTKLFELQDNAEEGEILAIIPAIPETPRRQIRISPLSQSANRPQRKGWLYREMRSK